MPSSTYPLAEDDRAIALLDNEDQQYGKTYIALNEEKRYICPHNFLILSYAISETYSFTVNF